MIDRAKILEGRKAVEGYRADHKPLHAKPWTPDVPEQHTPLWIKLVGKLHALGWDTLTAFGRDNEELEAIENTERLISLTKPSAVPFRFIDASYHNLYEGRALVSTLMKLRQDGRCGDTIIFFNPQWSEPKCTGSGEKLDEARTRLEALGIEYCRSFRCSGGPVIWNRDMVSIQAVTKDRFIDLKEARESWTGIALRTLKALGVVEESLSLPPSSNSIRVNKRKVGGVSEVDQVPVYLASFNLYLDCDYDRYQEIFACTDLRERITTLKELLGRPISLDEVKAALLESYYDVFSLQLQESLLTEAEKNDVEALTLEKYLTDQWNQLGVEGVG